MLTKARYISACACSKETLGQARNIKEKQEMHCYQYLAATVAVANVIEKLPGIHHRLPLCLIADWMAENEIEAEDVLLAGPGVIEVQVEDLVRQNQPRIQQAA